MTSAPKEFDLTPIGMKFTVLDPEPPGAGQSPLTMEWELLPKCSGAPVHIHPHATESYRVLAGELEVQVNGQWQTLRAGETLMVPPGTPHTFRNPLDTPTRIYNTHQPAQQFEGYFRDLCQVVNLVTDNGRNPFKPNLTTGAYMSLLFKRYPDEVVAVDPPAPVLSVLRLLAKVRGLRLP